MTAKRAAAAARSEGLLVHFDSTESTHAVTRQTVKAMAALLGLNENQVVHNALAFFRDKLLVDASLSVYEPDDGPLSADHVRAIKELVGTVDFKPTRSVLPSRRRLVDPE